MSFYTEALFRRYPELRGIPGPKPRFPLGNLREMGAKSATDISIDCAQTYGPYTLFWLLDRPMVFVHHPTAIDEILNTKRGSFYKDEPTDAMRPAATDSSVFLANGAEWSRKKRGAVFANDSFGSWLSAQLAPTRAYLSNRQTALANGSGPFEQRLYRLVFNLFCNLIFGRDLSDEDFERYSYLMDVIDFRMRTNLPFLSPKFGRVNKQWIAAIEDVVACNARNADGQSISHQLLRSSSFPREQLPFELANLITGGVFSVTAAIGHILALVSQNPQTDLRPELVALCDDGALEYSRLEAASALERVIREGLRLFPPAPVFLRRVKSPEVQVGALLLTEGVRIMIGIAPLQRDREHWGDADAFRPDRWTAEVMKANPYGSGYFFPFGRGPRSCSGGDMALFMIRTVLLSILGERLPLAVSWSGEHRFYFGCMMPTGMAART